MVKIAINGFGRIGRSFFRAAFGIKEFDIVAVNDLTDTSTLAYLLKYDSVYGRYAREVQVKDHSLVVAGEEIQVLAERDPVNLPWRDLGIDIVVESTGLFTTSEQAKAHLEAGAQRVIITAPATGEVVTALVGVNDDRLERPTGPITSNASCTTNSVAPVLLILDEAYSIEKASMVTVHSYTASQKLVDGSDEKDPRRGRAAAANIVPSSTGAAEAVIESLPQLSGKFDASAIRVPTITGSLSIMTVLVVQTTDRAQVNNLFRTMAKSPRWAKILKVAEDPIVSTDIIGEPYGAIIDAQMTRVIGGNLIEVFSWYDNESGYSATLVEHVRRVAKLI